MSADPRLALEKLVEDVRWQIVGHDCWPGHCDNGKYTLGRLAESAYDLGHAVGVEATAKAQECKLADAMFAMTDLLKARGIPFEQWPDDVKMKFSEAIIDHSPLTEAEIKRGQEIAAAIRVAREAQR